jgi:ubiquinone biosynthesis protein
MKRSTLERIREGTRLQQVFNVFARYGWDSLFPRWGLLNSFRLNMQGWIWRIPDDLGAVSMPIKLRMMLEELGPTYVKMGQIVSSQVSALPSDWGAELARLQSDVPPFPQEQVRERIIEELGAPPEKLFAAFEPAPFAAASTAQVHRAVLPGGQNVVVKVQRPDIRTQMKADLGIMQSAASVMARRWEYLRAVDLPGMLEQFSTNVLAELDYTGEAYNAIRLAQNMASIPGVHVPTVYPEYSTSSVLTMEYIKGVKLSNIAAIEKAGIDRATLARTALRAMIKQLLIDGFFHADPHPGNLLVSLETGTITFLDTGMVGELELQQRLSIIQLIFAIQQRDVKSMAEVLRNLSVPFVAHVDEKAYFHDFQRRIGRFMVGGAGLSFGQSVNESFDVLREHGLRLDPNLTLAIKAIMQAEAVATLLYPEGGLVNEGAPMIKELAVEAVTAEKVMEVAKDQLMSVGREVLKRIPSLSDATIRWLDQYQRGRFEVYVDTSGLAKEVTKIKGLGQQIVLAIVLVGMIVGSAIATSIIVSSQQQNGFWGFLAKLAYVGYVLAMIVGAFFVISLGWRLLRGRGSNKER